MEQDVQSPGCFTTGAIKFRFQENDHNCGRCKSYDSAECPGCLFGYQECPGCERLFRPSEYCHRCIREGMGS